LRLLRNKTILLLMGLEFARSYVLSRSAGHSAVKAAAYRSGEKLHDERVGRTADYSHRAGDVGHSEILLPSGASSEFDDRETLWGAVEEREDQHNRRASARLAVDHVIALPVELSREQHTALAKKFAEQEFVSRGLVVDLAIHYHSDGNPHAHLMTTTRKLEGGKFTSKDRDVDGKFYGGKKIADEVQLRHKWSDFQNTFFKENGIDAFITNNNGEYKAEKHLGAAHEMKKKGMDTELNDTVQETRTARFQAILDRPEIIINRVSDKKAVFTKHDLYRELNKVVHDVDAFNAVKAKLDQHPSLVKMQKKSGKQYLTTLDILNTEQTIRSSAERLSKEDNRFDISDSLIAKTLEDYSFLSTEQVDAVKHLTGKERLGIVMGLAGAGKSTMLEVVRRVNEDTGRKVHGVALAGKAADELEKSSGISSRTISSFIYGLRSGNVELNKGDVVVIDEFGMVSNSQALEILSKAEKAGAKVIGVGDTEQLQSIQAGAALRDLSEQYGFASIETIRRQQDQWQKDATFALAKGRVEEAIDAYRKNGNIHTSHAQNAVASLVSDYLADNHKGSKAVLAHRVSDVKSINEQIREGLKERGLLKNAKAFLSHSGRDEQRIAFDLEKGDEVLFNSRDAALGLEEGDRGLFVGIEDGNLTFVHDDGRELKFQPERYSDIDITDKEQTAIKIDLADGDRILFTQNDKELGVKNGQLGTLTSFKGDKLTVKMDSGDELNFNGRDYSDISHGYATTIHKSQGVTVDRSYVLGNESLDKHLTYVAGSRHRQSCDIYTDNESKFIAAASRENRQETALDFAERNELTLVSDQHSDTLDNILAGREEGQMVATNSESGGISSQDYQRASSLLAAERAKIVEQLTDNSMSTVGALQKEAEQLEAEIKRQKLKEPKAGLFKTAAFKENHADWKNQSQVLIAQRNNLSQQIKSQQSGRAFEERQEAFKQEAVKLVAGKLPRETELVDNFKADQLVSELTTKLNEIDKQITTARNADDKKDLPHLLKRKTGVLNTLQNRESIAKRLSENQKSMFGTALKNTKEELSLSRTRGLGR